ncbi:hypothetical protein HPB49_025780 [Dermacentor silvarum]|nr:hypothetical protein HPB49_025780 [Dermacentor silvarum]
MIPESTDMCFSIRAPSTEELVELRGRRRPASGQLLTPRVCTLDIERRTAYMNVAHNTTIAETYRKHAHAFGITSFSVLSVSFVDDVVKNLPPSGGARTVATCRTGFPPSIRCSPSKICRGIGEPHARFAAVANAADSQAPTLRVAKVLAVDGARSAHGRRVTARSEAGVFRSATTVEEELQSALS